MVALMFAVSAVMLVSCNGPGQNKEMVIEKAKQIPLEDFFKNPEKTSYQISPDGKYYSYKAPYEDRLNIFVVPVDGGEAIRLTSETDRSIAGYFWANNNRILYLKDNGGDENFWLYGVNIDGSDAKCYTGFEGVRTQIIDDLEDIPNEMIIGLNKRIPQVFDPYRLNLETGDMTILYENPGNIQGWVTDHDGKVRIAIGIEGGVNTTLMYRETENDDFKTILTTSFKDQLSPMFFTFDNKNLYATSNLGRDKAAAVIFDLEKAEVTEVLYENPDYDVSGFGYSPKRKVLTAAYYTAYKQEYHFFDQERKAIMDDLTAKLPGYEIALTGRNKDEDKFVIRTYSDRSLGSYYFYDAKTKDLKKITEVSPWIDENEMASVYPIAYQSRDGLKIEGYLTLPKGYTMENAKNLPVVVNPHGGPWARDSWGFNPEIQFLANRGFAILQMNFRGSTGYGKDFWQKSFKQWGLTMQEDITDGVNWLIEKGIADPSRIAIYGASYGGYATLQGIVVDPELYAAAVDYVGVSNLFTFMKTIPPYWEPLLNMMYEMVGNPETDSAQLAATSPALNADKIMTPLFIAQGANDPRVNKAESDQMVEALKERSVAVEYMVKDNEGHGFHNQENQFEFYGAMEKFLNKHMQIEITE